MSWILHLLKVANWKDWPIFFIILGVGGVPRLLTFKLKVLHDGALILLSSGAFRWELLIRLSSRVAMVPGLVSDGFILLRWRDYLKNLCLILFLLWVILLDIDRDRRVRGQRNAMFWILFESLLDVRWRFPIVIISQFRDQLVHRLIHFLFKLLLTAIWQLTPWWWSLSLAYEAALLWDYRELRLFFLRD